MSAANKGSILQSLDLNAALIESLPEPVLSELIGFIEYDNQLVREEDGIGDDFSSEPAPRVPAPGIPASRIPEPLERIASPR